MADPGVGEGKIFSASAGVKTAASKWEMGLQPLHVTCKTQRMRYLLYVAAGFSKCVIKILITLNCHAEVKSSGTGKVRNPEYVSDCAALSVKSEQMLPFHI